MFKLINSKRKTKHFPTLGKGGTLGNKSRKTVQGLFNQPERDQLDVFKQELEAFVASDNLTWRWKEESHGTTLEHNWTDLVTSHSTMGKMQRNQQAALWEFVHTELTYINKLKIIKDLVITALHNLHQHEFLQEVTPELLFSNLPAILQAHQLFWQEVVYPMLQEVRRTGKPFDPMRLEAGCLQFRERFSAYHDYCWEEENTLDFARRQMESNPHFVAFVQWVEDHPSCLRMRLGDMQAKPHVRITKYPLLLKSVLENTQEPQVQQALKGMLSSVKRFLESINDYIRLRDDELALSISAQRLEGYEVEGLNEEIDRYVREVSQFDLTCPIRGVGPGVIRKLLLEDNLKVRGRKDSKLELVALLFSDVLLLTKVQKKAERLKVVRPPLALDRMYCYTLKDGCSFVLVEVGELQSAMNVLILVASTSDRCSTWVSTIHQAKATLTHLREQKINRVDNLKEQQKTKPAEDTKMDEIKLEEKLKVPQKKSLMEELNDVLNKYPLMNGFINDEQSQPPNEGPTNNTGLTPKRSNNVNKLGYKSGLGQRQVLQGPEWIEMERRDPGVNQSEEEGKIVETQIITKALPVSKLNHFPQSKPPDLSGTNTTRRPNFLPHELPDVDYPTEEESTLSPPQKPQISSEMLPRPQVEKRALTRSNSDLQLVTQDNQKTFPSQSGVAETYLDVSSFPPNLKSPGLRKRRPVSTNPSPSTPPLKPRLLDLGRPASASNSSSNSDSECSTNIKRNSLPATFSSDLQQVPKVGPKPNYNAFLNKYNRIPPDAQNISESDLPDTTSQSIKPKIKNVRSSSSPSMINEGKQPVRGPSNSSHASPQEEDPSSSGFTINSSPVEGLLERAKERGKDKTLLKRDKYVKTATLKPKYQANFQPHNPAPSPTPSDGGRDTEEGEVELIRPRSSTVSMRWKEQLVDGDEDDKSGSTIFMDGEIVDWAGWCVDDEEVLTHLHPKVQGLPEGMKSKWGLQECQEDGEYSQV
ncbi:uncharacterized protein plekhg6 [Nematolebias whitei]|uniref:uncharacterized protein plekhg6 n=1 Tax=Nematolebias whitei TaxID=451745 RepID=UPI0018989E48|nr:uncharacterized protein plekhg6 [Nematolebias whitei]